LLGEPSTDSLRDSIPESRLGTIIAQRLFVSHMALN
jgi:hypothetical protein